MKKFLILIFCLTATFAVRAQREDLSPDEAVRRSFLALWEYAPQEKVFLHTDKTVYTAGECIWFRAYVVDAMLHRPTPLSRYVYVDLTDRQDSVIARVKLRETDSCFCGYVKLPAMTEPGEYGLRAYTRWMQNAGGEYFFCKTIRVINTLTEVQAFTERLAPEAGGGMRVTLVDNSGTPYAANRVEVVAYQGKTRLGTEIIRTNKQGEILLGPGQKEADRVTLAFPDAFPVAWKCNLFPSVDTPGYDIQFLPEGGHLLAATEQTVAFRAVAADGMSVEAEGEILTAGGEHVTHFRTLRRGMGTVKFTPRAGQKYYACVLPEGGSEKRVELPPVRTGMPGLRIERQGKDFLLTPAGEYTEGETYYVLCHCRGNLTAFFPVDAGGAYLIPAHTLLPGINHFVLIDSRRRVYSQRLCFVRPEALSGVTLTSDRPVYGRRDRITLDIAVQAADGQPLPVSCSVAVTDDGQVRPDSVTGNIVAYLLLQSDLRGHIEDPAAYLRASDAEIDLLMLTHGWTRFDMQDVLHDSLPQRTPAFAPELEQHLAGKVTNFRHQPQKGAEVQVFVPSMQSLGTLKTDDQGRFVIRQLDYPDSTFFFVRGFKEKGGRYVDVTMDEPLYLPSPIYWPRREPATQLPRDAFLEGLRKGYYYQNGVKIYVLEEAIVKARRMEKDEEKPVGVYTNMADRLLRRSELEKITALSVFDLLRRVPGVWVSGERVTIRGNAPLFLVDGLPTEAELVANINPSDVDNIGAVTNAATLTFFSGLGGGNGVIIINTRHGAYTSKPTPGMIRFYPLGYQQPSAFYVPAYDRPEERASQEADNRSTVFWAPAVSTDSTGQARLSFYAADPATTYTVTLQGITPDGTPFYATTRLRREDE